MHVRSRNLNFFDNFRRYFDNFRRYIYFPKSLSDRILRFRGIPWICCSPHLSEWDFRFRGLTCILQKNIFSGNSSLIFISGMHVRSRNLTENWDFKALQKSFVHIIYLTEISDFGSAHAFQKKIYLVEIWQNGSNDSCKQTSSSDF